jgi:N6-adenosine-specific RNA methylase IME4
MDSTIELPAGPFGAIMADPPWNFVTYDGKSSIPTQAEDPYPTMTLADLQRLSVADVAAPDCALFMWTVDAHLREAMDLGEAWGFEYKTLALIWVKAVPYLRGDGFFEPQMGMGYWTRKEAEVCLLFTRGKPKRLSRGVRQVIAQPRREHSRKPDESHRRVEALVGGPYLEMFAREPRPGWTVWGNDVEKFAGPKS